MDLSGKWMSLYDSSPVLYGNSLRRVRAAISIARPNPTKRRMLGVTERTRPTSLVMTAVVVTDSATIEKVSIAERRFLFIIAIHPLTDALDGFPQLLGRTEQH